MLDQLDLVSERQDGGFGGFVPTVLGHNDGKLVLGRSVFQQELEGPADRVGTVACENNDGDLLLVLLFSFESLLLESLEQDT